MHPFSVFAFSIFVAGYITARWDLVTRLYELAIFAWDHGVVVGSMCCLFNLRENNMLTSFMVDSRRQRVPRSLDILRCLACTAKSHRDEGA